MQELRSEGKIYRRLMLHDFLQQLLRFPFFKGHANAANAASGLPGLTVGH
jgi:hypothetical protein